jgi:3-dehydroquinate dehydratase
MEIVAFILAAVLVVAFYVIWNLYRKVAKQEDIIEYQVDYLRKVSYLIQESKVYIEQLDEKGTFRSDDEVGVFFNFMKEIQDSINTFRLPDDYGKTT